MSDQCTSDKKWGFSPIDLQFSLKNCKLYLYSYHCQDIMPFYNFPVLRMTFIMVQEMKNSMQVTQGKIWNPRDFLRYTQDKLPPTLKLWWTGTPDPRSCSRPSYSLWLAMSKKDSRKIQESFASNGGEGGTRTLTLLRARDFKSRASTSSATPPLTRNMKFWSSSVKGKGTIILVQGRE